MSEPLTVEESVWARWGRRVITVPLYLLLGTFTVAILPATIALALASDAVRRTGHLVTLRCTLGLTLYFACEAAGIVASFVLWVANALWPGATADRVVTWNLLLQRVWARTLFTGATRLFSMRTEVTGEEAVRRYQDAHRLRKAKRRDCPGWVMGMLQDLFRGGHGHARDAGIVEAKMGPDAAEEAMAGASAAPGIPRKGCRSASRSMCWAI